MERLRNTAHETFEDVRARRGIWLLAAAVFLVVLGVSAWDTCMFAGCPDMDEVRAFTPEQATVVLDRDGSEIGRLYRTQRTVVSLDSIPPWVPDAFVAMEDQRFYEHGGIDWVRVGGALRSNVESMGVREGGSTITMQLARNLYPELLPARERTFLRKLREMRVAIHLDAALEKRRILELYLNQIYFGEGAYGIEEAAREYFSKSARELSLAEAALLAGLPRAPSRYNPRVAEDLARERRNLVLSRMVDAELLAPSAAEAARRAPIAVEEEGADSTKFARWFVEEVRRQLQAELGPALYTGGYRVHTTMDAEAQRTLHEELHRQVEAIEAGRLGRFIGEDEEPLEFAGVMLDVRDGDVLALIGGRNFDTSKFNRATQARRQPGSAFKPVVYAAALGAGISPLHQISDEPVRIVTEQGTVWEPRNFSRDNVEMVSMRQALRQSRNVATVRLAQEVGLNTIARLAENLGLGQNIPAYPSLPLGTVETTPLALTLAFATFATLGERPEPRLVTHVEDRFGRTVWSAPVRTREVLDEQTAFLALDLMRSVVDGGTGWRVRRAGFYGPAAGKTGTTQDGADLWFAGVTPTTATTVWFGFDQRREVVAGGTGGVIAAPVWGRVMRVVGEEEEAQDWKAPPGLVHVRIDARGFALQEGCPGMHPVTYVWVREGPFTHERYCPSWLFPMPGPVGDRDPSDRSLIRVMRSRSGGGFR